jgi:ribonuclease P protein component
VKKRDRLRRQRDFQSVLRSSRIYSGRTLVGFAVPSGSQASRIGVTASRQVRGAVRRNRARRRLREVARLRLLTDDSPLRARGISYDVVLIARPPAVDAGFDELLADGEAFARRLEAAGQRVQR